MGTHIERLLSDLESGSDDDRSVAHSCRVEMEQMRSALEELADLMDSVVAGEYTPDSFTTQPARRLLTTTEAKK